MVQCVQDYVAVHSRQIADLVLELIECWVPRQVDRRVAKSITAELIGYLDGLSQRDHDARANFNVADDGLIDNLRHTTAYQARVYDLSHRLPDMPELNESGIARRDGLRESVTAELPEPRQRWLHVLSGFARQPRHTNQKKNNTRRES